MEATKAPEAERTRLSKEVVVERGLALADAEGLDALTIRRLATELGVTPMALYWHFRNKEELLAALGDQVWRELDTDIDLAAPWYEQMRGLLESLLHVLRSHPSASQLILDGEKQSDAALVAMETALAVLRRGGFDPEQAAEIARSALWTGLMLVMSEPGIDMLAPDDRAEAQRRKQVVLASLPSIRYPRLVECAIPMTACDDPEFHYELGVSVFIAGVQAISGHRK